ncbi:hypothetical protein K450DRAFT_263945 [Umbelopsis ramanniana AG]|uniref:Uncharacterized protein n=1 Tax=Umbelopsis ramanniana AG TaxID=1314678 RepID=A0AAD5H7B7_UMBRA|nr:uncharacterized protein K450DRAFT_263945 [Umbelopsis ramanniana AG]KAI8574967.1 hypothetical protein K450DRAFT_263945 [Umbelopsis ramanniana AG]
MGIDKMTELSCAQPSDLRQYWQRLNDPTLELRRRQSPWSIGPNFGLLIRHGAWMAFWKADIPHQARTYSPPSSGPRRSRSTRLPTSIAGLTLAS